MALFGNRGPSKEATEIATQEAEPVVETPVSEVQTETPVQPEVEPTSESPSGIPLMSSWTTNTNVPEGGPAPKKEPEPEGQPTDTTDPEQKKPEAKPSATFELDEKTRELLADAATDTTDSLVTSTIDFLNGPEHPKAQAATGKKREGIKSAFMLIMEKINYQPTVWGGLWAALFGAHGWALIAASIRGAKRMIKGTITWPWKKIKAIRNKEADLEVETVKPEQQRTVSTEPPTAVVHKLCLQTNQPFTAGTGYPKNPKTAKMIPLKDSFVSQKAFTQYCNENGLKGRGKKKK